MKIRTFTQLAMPMMEQAIHEEIIKSFNILYDEERVVQKLKYESITLDNPLKRFLPPSEIGELQISISALQRDHILDLNMIKLVAGFEIYHQGRLEVSVNLIDMSCLRSIALEYTNSKNREYLIAATNHVYSLCDSKFDQFCNRLKWRTKLLQPQTKTQPQKNKAPLRGSINRFKILS